MASSSSLNAISKPYFDFLPDELVVNILQKLPQRFVHRCKCVSKRWLTIILTDDFIRCYIEYHACLPNSKPPFALFYRHIYYFISTCTPLQYAFSENSLFKLNGFSLDFLSHNSFIFLASSNGLFLVYSKKVYCVCNPLTKQWVALPQPPNDSSVIGSGFVCKSTSSGCSFQIVLVHVTSFSAIKLVIYDSESKIWTQKKFNEDFLLGYSHPGNSEAITCNLLLHWLSKTGTIFVYDPYKCPDSYKIIHAPSHESFQNIKSMIGVCKEHLMYIEWGLNNFRVWELENYETEKWNLLQEFSINMETENYMGSFEEFRMLAIHPFNEEIVFLQQNNEVIWYNTRLNKLVSVNTLDSVACSLVYPLVFLPVTLPWWPVTVPPQ